MSSSRKPRTSASREVHPSLAVYRQKERGERLQKVLADAGVAARRECETLILEGAVTVNGKTMDTLPAWADPKVDRIEVYGKPLRPAEQHVYIVLFKPRGTVCTNSDPEGRPRAIDLVDHPSRARLYCVGRLDLDASGLLILTNDGEFANRLTHPRYEVAKGYDVTLDGRLNAESIAQIERKIFAATRDAGVHASTQSGKSSDSRSSLRLISSDKDKSIVHMELCEHRNLQIKDLMLSLGHPVKKMRRTSFGPLKLKGLAVGEWRELASREVEMLRRASRGETPAETDAKPKARSPKPAARPFRPATGGIDPATGAIRPAPRPFKAPTREERLERRLNRPITHQSTPSPTPSASASTNAATFDARDSKPAARASKPAAREFAAPSGAGKFDSRGSKPAARGAKPAARGAKPGAREFAAPSGAGKFDSRGSKPAARDYSKPAARASKPGAREFAAPSGAGKFDSRGSKPAARDYSKPAARASKPGAREFAAPSGAGKFDSRGSKPAARGAKPAARGAKPGAREFAAPSGAGRFDSRGSKPAARGSKPAARGSKPAARGAPRGKRA
jgi:23S rRNA pseudouridine2605 synthase